MDLGIAGRRALITGGTSGLGLAAARALAAEGVHTVIMARSAENVRRVCGELRAEFGVASEEAVGDITSRADVRRIADHLDRSGELGILVLNTPRPPSPMRDFLAEVEDDRWDEAYTNQLQGALYVLRAMTPVIAKGRWGRIIGVTSASVKQPMPRHALSSIYRAGVQAALKHLVTEVGPLGVTVNAVAPATIVTPTFASFHDLERRAAELPLQRAGRVDEFGAVVAFLASEGSGFITGQTIQLDGGMTTSLV